MIESHEAEFGGLAAHFEDCENARSVIVVEVTRVKDSCGYGVPLFQYEGERTQLQAWARKRGAEGLKAYRAEKNRRSIDGLAGVSDSTGGFMRRTARRVRGERLDVAVEAGKKIGILRLRESVRFADRLASLRMTNVKRMAPFRMTILFLICLSLVVANGVFVGQSFAASQSSSPAKAVSPVELSLVASEKSLIEAKKKDDGAYFKNRVSDGFDLVGIDGKLLEGQEALDNLGDSGLVELTPYDMKVVTVGEGAAIVTYDAIVRDAPAEDQGPPPRYQHFSSVWVKVGDGWKLKFHQATASHWGDW